MIRKVYDSFSNRFLAVTLLAAVWSAQPMDVSAQSVDGTHQHTLGLCGNEAHRVAEDFPDFWEKMEEFLTQLNQYRDQNSNAFELSENGNRIIPVVVHVLHDGGSENISRAQILDQLAKANLDFTFTNPDRLTIPPQFDSIAGNARIEFRLATKDPQGNCTDGINRVYTKKTFQARDNTGFKQLSYWDRSKYLNVWVVSTIESFGVFTTLGYAQFPYTFGGTVPSTSTDGIALIHNRIGTVGTATGTFGRTFTHEVGHWLGLRHIWGDAECGDDQVFDTPFHKESNFGCFTFPKEATCYQLNENSTAEDSIRRFQIGEMFNNYMDYSEDFCMSMFSEGQVEVIDFVFNTISFRSSLITNETAVATGTDDASFNNPCTPKPNADLWSRSGANLYLSKKLICAGGSLQFTDGSFGGTIDTRQWSLPGADDASPSATNPSATYATPGTYDATITVGNGSGSDTKTREDYVVVSSTTADETNWIYYDSFEYGSQWDQNKWLIINEGRPGNGWVGTSAGSYRSFKSVRVNNENGVKGESFFLVSPSYNLTTVPNAQLTFRYASAARTNNPNVNQEDELRVYVSTNCGLTWTARPLATPGVTGTPLVISGNNLYTAGLVSGNFAPSNDNEWKLMTVTLGSAATNANTRIMIQFTSGGSVGNHFYVDDVTIANANQPVSIDEAEGEMVAHLFPNPTSQDATLAFGLTESANHAEVRLLDMVGRVLQHQILGALEVGDHEVNISTSQLPSTGVYLVQLQLDGRSIYRRLVVE